MSNESAATRWWENYLVRYFLPSVAGMFILRWLDSHTGNAISNYVPMLQLKEWKDFGTAHLIVWLLLGSLYCYISSYPILVFHATRVLDFKDRKGTVGRLWLNPYIYSVIFSLLGYVAAWKGSLCLAIAAVIAFAGLQLVRLYLVYARQESFGFDPGFEASVAYAYLNKLSKRRGIKEETVTTSNEDEQATTERITSRFVDMADSYRHLREHGNTAFIFMLELALCPIFLIALSHQKDYVDFAYLAILLLIWVFPSALVHYLGQHLERRYSLFNH